MMSEQINSSSIPSGGSTVTGDMSNMNNDTYNDKQQESYIPAAIYSVPSQFPIQQSSYINTIDSSSSHQYPPPINIPIPDITQQYAWLPITMPNGTTTYAYIPQQYQQSNTSYEYDNSSHYTQSNYSNINKQYTVADDTRRLPVQKRGCSTPAIFGASGHGMNKYKFLITITTSIY